LTDELEACRDNQCVDCGDPPECVHDVQVDVTPLLSLCGVTEPAEELAQCVERLDSAFAELTACEDELEFVKELRKLDAETDSIIMGDSTTQDDVALSDSTDLPDVKVHSGLYPEKQYPAFSLDFGYTEHSELLGQFNWNFYRKRKFAVGLGVGYIYDLDPDEFYLTDTHVTLIQPQLCSDMTSYYYREYCTKAMLDVQINTTKVETERGRFFGSFRLNF
jgi:hypothetical protein